MKIAQLIAVVTLAVLMITAPSLLAAPCESVESAGASTAYQKIDAMLGEQIVVDHLKAVGLSADQARARVAQLSQGELDQLVAQADLIRAGGTIQRDERNLGPLDCIFDHLKIFFYDVYQVLFCWKTLK
ncbi:MAG TPA: PA2779 family protein [Verrucomicrobiae bacterium]|nr:PA2779 family protein [Verrucomicrobiae bacterium]